MVLSEYKEYYRNWKGKHVGSNVYIHRAYWAALPERVSNFLLQIDKDFFENIDNRDRGGYNIIKIDLNTNNISLILSSDFDSSDEPKVDYVYVYKFAGKYIFSKMIDYTKRDKSHIPVYHHKWMFVDYNYKGFDYEKSKRRSLWWQSHPVIKSMMSDDKHFKSRIGYYGYWHNILNQLGSVD